MASNNIIALNQVYNHYLTSYAPKSMTNTDTHKKSELRGVFNSIVKMNKDAPLYILDTSKATQEFAVGIKDNAVELRSTITGLGGMNKDDMLSKKAAYSSNEDLATVTYIGDQTDTDEVPSFEIEVKKLASGQTNTGKYLPNSQVGLAADTYSFDIGINDLNYEFQFSINEHETNRDVQERLGRLINNAGIGLAAQVKEADHGTTALELTSTQEGLPGGKEIIFQVSDDKTSKTSGAVDYFGLNYISKEPGNAEFIVNGMERSASSNNFTVEKMYNVQLTGVSAVEGETATIGLKTDLDSLTENINNLIKGYNSFLKAADEYRELHPKSGQLIHEMNNISGYYADRLSSLGIDIGESGNIEINEDELKETLLSEDGREQLGVIRDFANAVLRKSDQVSLNPMQYANRTIVAYKNPGHNFASPYITSAYTGMMFNSYC